MKSIFDRLRTFITFRVPPRKQPEDIIMAKKYTDPHQQELHDLIELKRARQAAAENRHYEADLGPAAEKIVPKTPKEKWDNFWFHYKKTVWISVVAVIGVIWLLKDTVFAPKPDMSLSLAYFSGRAGISALNDDLQEDFNAYIADYNGDGQVLSVINEMFVDQVNGDPDTAYGNAQKFIALLSTGEDLLFILDQPAYDYIFYGEDEPYSVFIDMEKLYPGLENAVGDKLYLNFQDENGTDTLLGKKWKTDYLNDEYFICVRHIGAEDSSAKDTEKNRAALDHSLDFVHKVVAETWPEWEGNQPVYDPETMNYLTIPVPPDVTE